MILICQPLEIVRVRAVIEKGKNFADIIIALILQVGAYIEPKYVPAMSTPESRSAQAVGIVSFGSAVTA